MTLLELVGSLIKSNLVNVVDAKVGPYIFDGKTLEFNDKYNGSKYINLIDTFYSLSNIISNGKLKKSKISS